MPKIPTYQRKLSIPGESGGVFRNVSSAGSEFGALAQAGNTLMNEADQVGNIIKQHQEKIRKQDIENKALLAASAYNEEQRIFRQSEEQRTGEESYQNMERGTKFRDDSIAKYTKDVTDPELKAKIQHHILSKSESLFDKLSAHQATQRQEVTKKAVEGIKGGLLKDAYDGDDLDDCIEEFQTTIKRQFDTGARGELSSIEEITKGESAIAEAHLDGLINRSPAAAIEAIKSGKYKQFLTQKQIEIYDKKAKELSEALKKDAVTAKKEADQATKEKLKAEREATGNEFVSKHVAGKLTRADVLKANLEPTGENSKQYWLNQIEQMEDKLKKGSGESGTEGFKTDKTLDARLYSQIVKDPESITESQILSYLGNGLSRSSVDSLLTERRQRLNPQKDPARTAAEAAVTENLKRDRKAGVFGTDQAGDVEYAKQVDAFRRWSKANPDQDPSEYYEKVMEPVKKSFVFDFLSKDKPEPKAKREAMEKAGEIPQRRVTDKKGGKADPLGLR